jgi:hypothetical protein
MIADAHSSVLLRPPEEIPELSSVYLANCLYQPAVVIMDGVQTPVLRRLCTMLGFRPSSNVTAQVSLSLINF